MNVRKNTLICNYQDVCFIQILVYSQWKVQRISDSSLPHSYWPRDSGDPSSWYIFYKYCTEARESQPSLDNDSETKLASKCSSLQSSRSRHAKSAGRSI